MKNYLFIAAAACVALAACTKNEVKPVEVDQEITFQAVVNKASTKAMIDGITYDPGNTFGTVFFTFHKTSTVFCTTPNKKKEAFLPP